MGEDGEPPSIYGDTHFLNCVVNELKCNLPVASEYDLLDDNSRYKIMFKCGTLLDCRTGERRKALPADRISKHTGYRYQEVDNHGLKALIYKTVSCLNEFWAKCGAEFSPVYDEKHLAPLLDSLLEESEAYKAFYGLFECHDLALWLMRQTARAAAGIPFEEFLYMSNSSGQNGKGMWIKIMMKLLGANHDNYFHTLE